MDKLINKINKKTSIIMIVIALVLIVILGFSLLLELGRFSGEPREDSFAKAINEARAGINIYDESRGMLVPVSNEIKTMMCRKILEKNLDESIKLSYVKCDDIHLDINARYSGISMPIRFKVSFSSTKDAIGIAFSDMRITRHGFRPPLFIKKIFSNILEIKEKTFNIAQDEIMPMGFFVDSFSATNSAPEGACSLNSMVKFDTNKIKTMISSLEADNTLMILYKENMDNSLASAIINNNGSLSFDEKVLVKIAIKEPSLIYDILAMFTSVDDELIADIADYGLGIDKDEIKKVRNNLYAYLVDDYVKNVLVAFTEHFKERKYLINQGLPYDIAESKLYTVLDLINEKRENEIKEGKGSIEGIEDAKLADMSDSVYDEFYFVYDDALKIACKMDENSYYIRGVKTREYMSAGQFFDKHSTYDIQPVEQVVEKRDEIIAFFKEHFKTEKIFIRYFRKAGDKYIIILSSADDVQDYFVVAFELLGDEIRIIDDNINSVEKFLRANESFAGQLFPKEMSTSRLSRVTEDTISTIIDELMMKNIIARDSKIGIDYVSFDGKKYIYFRLSDGRDFVFRVQDTRFGRYLTTVYPKEKAFKHWSDINRLISLEDEKLDLSTEN